MENKIKDDLFWVGVNDNTTELFENLWSLENGISYNSYLINDDKNVLIDTVDIKFAEEFFNNIHSAIGNGKIDYVIINHIEPDHSGSLELLIKKYPEIKIIGNKKTANMLKGFFDIIENVEIVKDGEERNFGNNTLKFYLTSLLHWPETMMTYSLENKILFSGDAFGAYGKIEKNIFDENIDLEEIIDEATRYYSNIVCKYSGPVKKALKKLNDINIEMIAPTHGYLWKNNVKIIIDKYYKWSDFEADKGVVIAYGSMYGNTEKIAYYLKDKLISNGCDKVVIYNMANADLSYVLRDVLKYKFLITGSPTYNSEVFPPVDYMLNSIKHSNIKNRIAGVFGSYSWSSAAVKKINEYYDTIGFEKLNTNIDVFCTPIQNDYANSDAMVDEIMNKMN